ncbi:M1 family metallopeptidase [Novosphingobium sp. PS1R-30]|uniref:Aminopeptidase n=1 Tax=Novosphingobium anseongense TaxID=3133436 RepID=A0ABU8RVZ9_9SPHN
MIRILLASLLATVPAQVLAQAPAPTESAPYPKGQLTDAVQPQDYRLDLTLDPAREGFSGKVEIDALLKRPSATIHLHGRDLTMRSATARVGNRTIPGTWKQLDDTGVAALTFAETLPAGPVILTFDYDAKFQEGPAGLFRVNVGGVWHLWSQFQSIDARAAFPGFDQPSFKTSFTVTLRTPPGLKAVSNAPETGSKQENGLEVHRFARTLPLPTYLVAMMVGPFETLAGEVAPTPQRAKPLPLRVVSTKQNAEKLDFALQGSKEIVALLEDYFADGFPYPKLDQITSPIMPGAMENAGADLYGDPILIMDRDAPTPQKRQFGMVVAHELAHQWFGDLVTPTWWDDIWLNESFANWMGYRIGEAWRPDLNIGAGALAEGFAAMDTDALVAGRPIHQPIATNGEIDSAFDSITYGKGGHVVAMIAAFMGDAKFRDGVRRYMAAHRYGNATSTDFFKAMAEAAHDPRIIPAMQSFVDQQGVPLLTFSRTSEGGYSVRQSRYAALGSTPPATRWGVPLCVRRGEARSCSLLTEENNAVSLPTGNGPLVPNAGGTGYYRFELPAVDWDALIAGAEGLSGGEAQALADSLQASVLAGRGNATRLATLAERLVHHPDTYASDTATDALGDLAAMGLIDDRGRRGLRRLVERLYRPLLTQYGFDPRAGAYAAEAPERAQRRVQIVARLAGAGRDKALRSRIAAATRAFLAGDDKALDRAWYGIGFEMNVAQGKISAAKVLIDKALASEDPAFRPVALAAAANSGSKDVANWLLNGLSDRRLRASEKHDMLRGVLLTGQTREIGYTYLRAHLDALTSGSNGIFFASKLPQFLARFCSAERADEFARDLRPRFAGKPGALELERTIERVRNCGLLRDKRETAISSEFARFR